MQCGQHRSPEDVALKCREPTGVEDCCKSAGEHRQQAGRRAETCCREPFSRFRPPGMVGVRWSAVDACWQTKHAVQLAAIRVWTVVGGHRPRLLSLRRLLRALISIVTVRRWRCL